MIDTHAHVYKYVTGRFGLDADMCGVDSGVTTLIDQGGPSCMTLPGFRHFIVEPAKTRVVAFISAYLVGGMEGHYYPELYAPTGLDPEATVKAAKENRRPRQGREGPCRDRRLRALRHQGDRDVGADRARGRASRSTSTSASCGACRRKAPTASMPTPSSSRSSNC